MQVYQPFDLVLGVAMVLLGLLGLGRDTYRGLTRTFSGDYADWRALSLSVFFVADGPSHCSKAFDLPHQESHRTAVLIGIALPIMFIVIVANLVAQLAHRKRKKSFQALQDTAERGR